MTCLFIQLFVTLLPFAVSRTFSAQSNDASQFINFESEEIHKASVDSVAGRRGPIDLHSPHGPHDLPYSRHLSFPRQTINIPQAWLSNHNTIEQCYARCNRQYHSQRTLITYQPRSIPDYSKLLDSSNKPTEQQYEHLFHIWMKENKKQFTSRDLERRSFHQFRKFVDLNAFAEGSVPTWLINRLADRDLTEYLNERMRIYRGRKYNPQKDHIDLDKLWTEWKNKYKRKYSPKEEQRRFAAFLVNLYLVEHITYGEDDLDPTGLPGPYGDTI